MKTPVSQLNAPDMQAAPVALMRAAERARRLAEQTGTRFVVRSSVELHNDGRGCDGATQLDSDERASLPPSESSITISLTAESARAVRDAVQAGEYASSSEILCEALRDWRQKRALRKIEDGGE